MRREIEVPTRLVAGAFAAGLVVFVNGGWHATGKGVQVIEEYLTNAQLNHGRD